MHLTNEQARRVFLDRHHLLAAPRAPVGGSGVEDLVGRLGFVQVDSINTVERAHHMILWSRAERYRPKALRGALEVRRSLWEHWTHDASILPVGLFPMWRARFRKDHDKRAEAWRKWFREGYENQFEILLERIARDGPVSSSDVGEGEARGKGGWWDWHPSKTALEWLWRTGQIAVTRREGFQKVYDLTERVIPAAYRKEEPDEEAVRDWACRSALAQLGFGSIPEIAAYWNAIGSQEVRLFVEAALARGELRAISYDDWTGRSHRAFALASEVDGFADPPRPGRRLRVLSPFDPALRDRKRAERLFGFHYRIEVFTPAPQRIYGYYVFPVLEGDRLIGRLDAKALRVEGVLSVTGFWPEAGVAMTPGRQAALQAELARLADLAGVGDVAWADGWLRAPVAAPAGG